MMNKATIVLVVLLFAVMDTHAQSAKKINQQLKRELEVQQVWNDSLRSVYHLKSISFRTMSTSAGTSLFGTLKAVNFEVEEMRYKCSTLKDTLMLLAISESQLEKLPQVNTGYYALKAELFPVLGYKPKEFVAIVTTTTELPSKMKEQNVAIQTQLKTMRVESDSLKVEIQRIDLINKKLKEFNQTSDNVMGEYSAQLAVLTAHYKALLQKKSAVKQDYLKKGPKGYGEIYKQVFTDIFQNDPYWTTIQKPLASDGMVIMDQVSPDYVAPKPLYDESYIYYEGLDEKAEFVGGKTERLKFISENIFYPDFALSKGIGGRCLLKFVVNKAGEISEPMVAIGVDGCPECDAEALRVLLMMPEWIPAKKDGKSVNSYVFLPINFKP